MSLHLKFLKLWLAKDAFKRILGAKCYGIKYYFLREMSHS